MLANDTDLDTSDSLSITAATLPANSGSVSVVTLAGHDQLQFNPGTDFDYLAVGESAQVTINYSISDGHGGTDSSTLTITVTGTNDMFHSGGRHRHHRGECNPYR